MDWTQEKIDQTFVEVKKKAVVDANFRKLLLSNPNEAIKQVAGVDIPAGYKIKIIENDPNYHMTFVLPDMVSEELFEEDMDKVAGGACFIDGCGLEGCANNADVCAGKDNCLGQASR